MEVLNSELLRGFTYLYGRDLAVTKEVTRACERLLAQAGFEEILPPTVVEQALIVGETDRPVAPAGAAAVFSLQTAECEQGQDLALSYETTVPVCVFYLQNFAGASSQGAQRFYYISTNYRNETETAPAPSLRLRQFHQVGYEILGGVPPETLPVAIRTGSDLLTGLGLAHTVRISDVTILSSVFRRLRLGETERSTLRFHYDSQDSSGFESYLAQLPLDPSQKALLARLFFSRDATLRELEDVLREYELEDTLPRIERIRGVLDALPPAIRHLAALDLGLVRSARMYSGMIYQYYLEGSSHECGGGGECNRLVESLGGPDTAACGAAFGLERLIHAAKKHFPAQAEALGKAAGR